MKKLFVTTTMVAAFLSCAGVATAGTYQGVASHDGTRWRVTWSNVVPTCNVNTLVYRASDVVAKIDNVDTPLSLSRASQLVIADLNYVEFDQTGAGTMTKLTFDGHDSFQCDGHTFLLPGYVAPPAAIPTMSEWAMILLGMVLAGGAALTLQRRRQAA